MVRGAVQASDKYYPVIIDVFDSVPEADVAEAAIRLSDEILTNGMSSRPSRRLHASI